MPYVEMKDLEGLVFTNIEQSTVIDDELRFVTDTGDVYKMYHAKDCCENVILEEIIGDLEDLIDTPILKATESSDSDRSTAEMNVLDGEEYVMMKLSTFNDDAQNQHAESQTWTFYSFRTIKGSVTLRWYGTSNGYYSESVDIYKLD